MEANNEKTKSPFSNEGHWYKGNLHCHSTFSDGELTVDELINAYKAEGYSFLATSEHDQYYNCENQNTEDFILLPALEYSFKTEGNDYRVYHLNVFAGTDDMLRNAKLPMYLNMEKVDKLPFSKKGSVTNFV